ncbi:hypothetical protein FHS39_002163 [Streptomyces olivoverticillatus]|uniref:DUF6545 domain-containing protein n=1 Tax=Streptomyces olivoverticillatus TaxID=66427 RepID=A0A7W7PKE2_9ACTN|nr:MAB_1171c family putative transporter [Streptomyces olivoverticillatus]MBB4893132.1 hypothetical protein [Streptomyces olivoverticillatus]
MHAEAAAAGTWFGNASTVCLWVAVLLRAPAAMRHHWQRSLWLAVATAAAAMALNLPPVLDALHGVFGPSHVADLARNLIGVLSAAAVLDFVTASTGERRWHRQLAVAAAAVMAVLLLLDFTAPAHERHVITPSGVVEPSTAYWLVLIAAHLAADLTCVMVCSRYSRIGSNRAFKACLRLFSWGTAFSALFWAGYLTLLVVDEPWIRSLLPWTMALHGLLRASALALPTLFSLRQKVEDIVTIWRLWPMWCDLIAAVPHVALDKPRPRMVEIVRPKGPWDLLAYRKVIEIRDAILVMRDHTPPALLEEAQEYVESGPVAPAGTDATVMACALRVTRPAGSAPSGAPTEISALGGEDLWAETAFLVQVAKAYGSPLVRAFAEQRAEPDPA